MSATTLKERIAALERGESPTSLIGSKTSPSSPPKTQSSSASFPGLRDRIARFEGIGGTPIPRGSFGLGAPLHHDKRSNELYGNRIPSVSKVTASNSLTVTPSTSSEGLHAAFSRSSSRSPSLSISSPHEGLHLAPTPDEPTPTVDETDAKPPVKDEVPEAPEAITPIVAQFTPEVPEVPEVEVLEVPEPQATPTPQTTVEETPLIEEKVETEDPCDSSPSTAPVVKESNQDDDPDTSSDGNASNPRSSLTSVTSNEAPAPITPLTPLFDSFPVPPKVMTISTGGGEHTRSRSAHFADDLSVPSRSPGLAPNSSSGQKLTRSATTSAAGRRPRSKVLQPGVWINSDDEDDGDDDEGPGWASVVVTKRYL